VSYIFVVWGNFQRQSVGLLLCSGCRPSLALGELTLTAINRSLALTTEARTAVSYAKCSGRRSGWCGFMPKRDPLRRLFMPAAV
jgi:hypothetical protein